MFLFFKLIGEVFELIWRGVLLFWVNLNALGTWLHAILHAELKHNDFITQIVLFVIALILNPFPWYTSTAFIFIPAKESFFILSIFFLEFLFSLIHGVVFLV